MTASRTRPDSPWRGFKQEEAAGPFLPRGAMAERSCNSRFMDVGDAIEVTLEVENEQGVQTWTMTVPSLDTALSMQRELKPLGVRLRRHEPDE